MKKVFTNCSVGEIVSFIRKNKKLTTTKFGNAIDKSHVSISYIESEKNRIYIDDFMKILKKFSMSISFVNDKDKRKITINDYKANDLLRVLRESSDKTQGEFAKDIGFKNDWCYTNEAGINSYYANDLFLLAKKNGFHVELNYEGDNI